MSILFLNHLYIYFLNNKILANSETYRPMRILKLNTNNVPMKCSQYHFNFNKLMKKAKTYRPMRVCTSLAGGDD